MRLAGIPKIGLLQRADSVGVATGGHWEPRVLPELLRVVAGLELGGCVAWFL